MTEYVFHKGEADNGEDYANFDHVANVQNYYLTTIGSIMDGDDMMDMSDIIRHIMIQLFIHEDLHTGIENIGMDTIGESQHQTIYPIICGWNKKSDE